MIYFLSLLSVVTAFNVGPSAAPFTARRAAAVTMNAMPEESAAADDVLITTVTRSREVRLGREGSVVVTDGSGSFYGSRTIFNMLYDFGNFASITAYSEDTANAKKMLISRQTRYSGLIDVLEFVEGAPAGGAFSSDVWLAIDPDEAALPMQLTAAAAAGVKRVFLLLSDALADAAALDTQLAASGLEYTVMRTGPLVAGPGGSGLKLAELDMPVCDEVPREGKRTRTTPSTLNARARFFLHPFFSHFHPPFQLYTDVFRFVTEAITLPEANKRSFSLCPSPGVESTLKQMRLAGYERREEVQLLLQGVVKEQDAAPAEDEEMTEEQQELVLRSEAEVAAEREDELKMLLARAKQRGIETQERLAFEEKEKAAKREEMAKYYSTPGDDSETPGPRGEGSSDAAPVEGGEEEDKPEEKPDAPPAA